MIVIACLFCYIYAMKNTQEKRTNNEKIVPLPLLDSYDNDAFVLMLEEIGAIKGEQCTGSSILIPTKSK